MERLDEKTEREWERDEVELWKSNAQSIPNEKIAVKKFA